MQKRSLTGRFPARPRLRCSVPLLQTVDFAEIPDWKALLQSWWEAHEAPGQYPSALVGGISRFATLDGKPVAFLSVSMDNSKGKATLESIMTAPGLSQRSARKALLFLENAVISVLRSFNYTFLQSFVPPAIARTMEREGWLRQSSDLIHFIRAI